MTEYYIDSPITEMSCLRIVKNDFDKSVIYSPDSSEPQESWMRRKNLKFGVKHKFQTKISKGVAKAFYPKAFV